MTELTSVPIEDLERYLRMLDWSEVEHELLIEIGEYGFPVYFRLARQANEFGPAPCLVDT